MVTFYFPLNQTIKGSICVKWTITCTHPFSSAETREMLSTNMHMCTYCYSCNNGLPVSLACHGDYVHEEKTDSGKDRGRACMCVCICACASDSPEAKALLMNSKWLWEVNKQTLAAATTTHQTPVTRTSGWLHIHPYTQTHQPTYPWTYMMTFGAYSRELKSYRQGREIKLREAKRRSGIEEVDEQKERGQREGVCVWKMQIEKNKREVDRAHSQGETS